MRHRSAAAAGQVQPRVPQMCRIANSTVSSIWQFYAHGELIERTADRVRPMGSFNWPKLIKSATGTAVAPPLVGDGLAVERQGRCGN